MQDGPDVSVSIKLAENVLLIKLACYNTMLDTSTGVNLPLKEICNYEFDRSLSKSPCVLIFSPLKKVFFFLKTHH